ncbi:hypothetical protein LCGC14_2744610, partial [marine sediment metagenome]
SGELLVIWSFFINSKKEKSFLKGCDIQVIWEEKSWGCQIIYFAINTYYKENKIEKKADSLNSLNDNNEVKVRSTSILQDFNSESIKIIKTPGIPFKGFDSIISIFLATVLPYILIYFYYVFSVIF